MTAHVEYLHCRDRIWYLRLRGDTPEEDRAIYDAIMALPRPRRWWAPSTRAWVITDHAMQQLRGVGAAPWWGQEPASVALGVSLIRSAVEPHVIDALFHEVRENPLRRRGA